MASRTKNYQRKSLHFSQILRYFVGRQHMTSLFSNSRGACAPSPPPPHTHTHTLPRVPLASTTLWRIAFLFKKIAQMNVLHEKSACNIHKHVVLSKIRCSVNLFGAQSVVRCSVFAAFKASLKKKSVSLHTIIWRSCLLLDIYTISNGMKQSSDARTILTTVIIVGPCGFSAVEILVNVTSLLRCKIANNQTYIAPQSERVLSGVAFGILCKIVALVLFGVYSAAWVCGSYSFHGLVNLVDQF